MGVWVVGFFSVGVSAGVALGLRANRPPFRGCFLLRRDSASFFNSARSSGVILSLRRSALVFPLASVYCPFLLRLGAKDRRIASTEDPIFFKIGITLRFMTFRSNLLLPPPS